MHTSVMEQAQVPVANDDIAETAFQAGDYTTAALSAKSDELRGAALVLLGNHEDGMPLLEGLSSPRATFYRAFGLRGLGHDDRAQALFRQLQGDPTYGKVALVFLSHLRSRRIRVLLQGRSDPGCPDYDFVGAARTLPHLDIKVVGYSASSDIVIDHTTTYEEMMFKLPSHWQPDFFLSHLVEDNPPPIGIEFAAFPTFCHTQDYDRHFHHCIHYLRLFDSVIALGRADHDDMRRLTGASVFVFPKLLGISLRQDRKTHTRRDTDVFVSGSLFNLTRSKSQYIFDVTQLPSRYRIEMVDGYMSTDDYYRSLGRAKATFTHVHRWGLINGRAIEAISQGTCALYQEGGELGIFLKEEDGAIPYGPGNAMATLEQVIDQWESKYAACAKTGSKKVANIFKFETCVHRYIHFLELCAAQGVQRNHRSVDPVFSQIRYPNRSPQRTWFHFDHSIDHLKSLHSGFRDKFKESTSYAHLDACGESLLYSYLISRPPKSPGSRKARWPYSLVLAAAVSVRKRVRKNSSTKALLTRLARFVPLSTALRRDAFIQVSEKELESLIHDATDTYRKLSQAYPDRIAARFNLARIEFEHKNDSGAAAEFERILNDRRLAYHSTDLLFWREFHDDFFDYEFMMQQSIAYAKDSKPEHLAAIERAIRESSRLYLATIHARAGRLAEAVEILGQGPNEGWQFARAQLALAAYQCQLEQLPEAEENLRLVLRHDRSLLLKFEADSLEKMYLGGCDIADLIAEQRFAKHRGSKAA
jgi:hypothetical protein